MTIAIAVWRKRIWYLLKKRILCYTTHVSPGFSEPFFELHISSDASEILHKCGVKCNIFISRASFYMVQSFEERTLLYRIQAERSQEAFGTIYDTYVSEIYRFVFFKLSSKEEAEDVVADVFLKTWEYLMDSPEEIRSIRHLLYRIARNRVIDVYRERARLKEYRIVSIHEVVDDHAEMRGTEKLDVLQSGADVERIMKEIRKLKQEYQDVLFLRYVDQLSIGEIAKVLEKGSTNVRVTLHRATKKLKELCQEK